MLWSCAALESKPELSDLVAARLHSYTVSQNDLRWVAQPGCSCSASGAVASRSCAHGPRAQGGADVVTGRVSSFQAWAFARLGKPEPSSLIGLSA